MRSANESKSAKMVRLAHENPAEFGRRFLRSTSRASGLLGGPVMTLAEITAEAAGQPLFPQQPQQGFRTRYRPNPAATQGIGAYTTGVDYVRQKALRDRLTVLRQSGPETYHRIFGENPGTLFPPPYIRETFGPPGST